MKNPFTISTIELLFLCDDDFKFAVNTFRKKFNIQIDKEGKVSDEEILSFDKKLLIDHDFSQIYNQELEKICIKFDLQECAEELGIFIESGVVISDIDSAFSEAKIVSTQIKPRSIHGNDLPKSSGFTISFCVRKPINEKDLKLWLSRNTESIILESEECFKGLKQAITINTKLPRIIDIFRLREKGLKFREIADFLCNKYSEDPEVISGQVNEQSVKMIHRRYSKHKK